MLRTLSLSMIAVLAPLAASCARSSMEVGSPETPAIPDVEGLSCELVSVAPPGEDGTAVARFRVTNGTNRAFAYRAYSKESPMYRREVFEGGAWKPSFLGWCGTGLKPYTLKPGETVRFEGALPERGKRYRFRFADLPMLSPAVSTP